MTGHDTRRDQVVEAVHYKMGEGLTAVADAVMPILDAAVAEARAETAEEWEPDRWWRAVGSDGEVWCESSDEDEVREEARPGDRVERLWRTVVKREWRTADIARQHADGGSDD